VSQAGLPSYRCSPTILWLKDADQTILIDTDEGASWSMSGAEAVIWDLFTLGHTAERVAAILHLLLGQTSEEAWRTLRAVVRVWEQEGILRPTVGDRYG
jgi:hypothetical protein